MKWFKPDMSASEAKKLYRELARTWHPDLHEGKPDYEECEANFKEISSEYTAIIKGEISAEENWFDEEGATNELYSRLEAAEKVIQELFPKLRVAYWAYLLTPTITFPDNNVPMYKIMTVVEVVQQMVGKAKVTVHVPRDCRKKDFVCVWYPTTRTLVVEGASQFSDWHAKGAGRRYKEFDGGRAEKITDTKTGISYVKNKSPKVDFRKDFLRV